MDDLFHEFLEAAGEHGDAAHAQVGVGHDTIVDGPVEQLDMASALVSELMLTCNQLAGIARDTGAADMAAAVTRLSSVVTEIQDRVVHTGTEPLERLFAALPELARDLSSEFGKDISIVVEGAQTKLDRQLIDAVREPLIRVIRHCANHSLETTDQRLATGKPATGTIRIAASPVAGQILIEVSDDGRGLDLARIGATALRHGLLDEASLPKMTIDDVARLIFAPGLSTASALTSISGLDVGLGGVRTAIETIGGAVTVSSVTGAGTRFTISIPLTLPVAAERGSATTRSAKRPVHAPAPTIEQTPLVMFRAGSPTIKTLPLDFVKRIENISPSEVERSAGRFVTRRDDGLPALLPLIEGSACRDSEQPVLIVEMAGHTFGLLVDEIVDIADTLPDLAISSLVPAALGDAYLGGHVAETMSTFRAPRDAGLTARASRSFEITS